MEEITVRISELPGADPLSGIELVPLVQNGVTKTRAVQSIVLEGGLQDHIDAPDPHPQYAFRVKNNLSATTDPTANDDVTQGYEPTSRWVNTVTEEFFICVTNTTGNANWQQQTLTLDELGSAALVDVGLNPVDVPQNQNLGTAAYKDDGAGNGLNADLLDGVQASQFVRSDQDDVVAGQINFLDSVEVQVSSSDTATIGLDARDDDSIYARLHVFGRSSTGGTGRARLALYDGNSYHNIDVINDEFIFGGGLHATGGFRGDGSQLTNVSAQTLDGIDSSQFVRSEANDIKTGYLWLQDELFVGDSAANAARLRVVGDASRIYFQAYDKDNTAVPKEFVFGGYGGADIGEFRVRYNGAYHDIWHSGNDGSGSGLDADTVDGLQASQFVRSDTDDTMTGNLTISNTAPALLLTESDRPGGENQARVIATEGILYVQGTTNGLISFTGFNGADVSRFDVRVNGSYHDIWHEGNDGAGSGLDADLLDGLQSTQFVRSDTADTISGRLTLTNSGGTETHYGIHGGYNDANGSGSDWGVPIWTMGDGYMGSGTGTGFTPGGYQLYWLRAGSVHQRAFVGEGLYIHSQNSFVAGFGTGGAEIAGRLKVGGDLLIGATNAKVGTNATRDVYIQTTEPLNTLGNDGDVCYVYVP